MTATLTAATQAAAQIYADLIAGRPDDKASLALARADYKAAQAREMGLPADQTWEINDEPEDRRALTAAEKTAKAAGALAKKSSKLTAKQNAAPPRVCRVCCKSFSAYFRRLYCSENCYQAAMLENKRRRKAERQAA